MDDGQHCMAEFSLVLELTKLRGHRTRLQRRAHSLFPGCRQPLKVWLLGQHAKQLSVCWGG